MTNYHYTGRLLVMDCNMSLHLLKHECTTCVKRVRTGKFGALICSVMSRMSRSSTKSLLLDKTIKLNVNSVSVHFGRSDCVHLR